METSINQSINQFNIDGPEGPPLHVKARRRPAHDLVDFRLFGEVFAAETLSLAVLLRQIANNGLAAEANQSKGREITCARLTSRKRSSRRLE